MTDLAWQMAVAWQAQPALGAQNRWVFDACSDSAGRDEEGELLPLCLLEAAGKAIPFLGVWGSRNSAPSATLPGSFLRVGLRSTAWSQQGPWPGCCDSSDIQPGLLRASGTASAISQPGQTDPPFQV